MILEKVYKLDALLTDKRTLEANQKNALAFEQRANQIGEAIHHLMPLTKSLNIFRERNLIEIDLIQDFTVLLKVLRNALKQFKEDPQNILDNTKFNFKRHVEPSFLKLCEQVNAQLNLVWNQYTEEKLKSVGMGNLELFQKIPDFRQSVERIQGIIEELNALKDNLPQEKLQFEAFDQKIEQIRVEMQELGSDQIPENVLLFLRAAVSNKGVPIDALTPEIIDWLREHGIFDSFRIAVLN